MEDLRRKLGLFLLAVLAITVAGFLAGLTNGWLQSAGVASLW